MATLPEIAEWIAGVYQIEQTDPVLGGAVNETTGAGITNLPALQLAKRTAWLKQALEAAGIGVDALTPVDSFDAITQGGMYLGLGTATGSPDSSAVVTLLHLPSNSAGAAAQIAVRFGTINRAWLRRKQAGAWAAWVEVLTGSNVQSGQTDAAAGRLMTVGAFGLGATSSPIIPNLNEATLPTGTYRTRQEETTAGTFPTGFAGAGKAGILQVHRHDAGSVQQTWRPVFNDQIWERRYTLETWQPWRRSWDGQAADFSATANGYQRLPSGLILQWGNGGASSGSGAITFPIAFPNQVFAVVVGDFAQEVQAGYSHIISAAYETRFGFTAVCTSHDGVLAASAFRYMAIGN